MTAYQRHPIAFKYWTDRTKIAYGSAVLISKASNRLQVLDARNGAREDQSGWNISKASNRLQVLDQPLLLLGGDEHLISKASNRLQVLDSFVARLEKSKASNRLQVLDEWIVYHRLADAFISKASNRLQVLDMRVMGFSPGREQISKASNRLQVLDVRLTSLLLRRPSLCDKGIL